MTHIAVIGAGITGVFTAYALLERGYSVSVFDRQRYAGMETSFANGGQLSASNAEVWNSWSTILHGLQWMLRADAPLLMNPKPSWHKYSWMAEFVGNVMNHRSNTVETTRLAIKAREYMFSVAEREQIRFDLERRGILHVYHDKASFENAAKTNALLLEGGLDRRAVTLDEMRRIEPALSGNYYGGYFTPSDATGDIHKFTRGLAQACLNRGATFNYEADVTNLNATGAGVEVTWSPLSDGVPTESRTDKFDGIVVCAGIASRRFARMLGDRVNIYPVKGYSITVLMDDKVSQESSPWVSLLDESAKIVTSRLGEDRLRVAGTAEFNGENRDIRADRIRPLVAWTRRHFPGVDTGKVIPWAGLRPMTPSMMPRVGAGSRPGVFYNTGHGHLGWTLAAATAQMVAEQVAGRYPSEAVSAAAA
jgi:D-amino-acid dehydrogenase